MNKKNLTKEFHKKKKRKSVPILRLKLLAAIYLYGSKIYQGKLKAHALVIYYCITNYPQT
jgi:hypothetical protein